MADLTYECPNDEPHGPHTWPQGFCEGIEAPPPLLCSGSGLSWIWDKGAAVCQRCHEPATWMGLRAPRRKNGAFRTKVPPHVNRMPPGEVQLSAKAQIEILKDEVERLYAAARTVVDLGVVHPRVGHADEFYTALNVLGGSTRSPLVTCGRVEAENKS